MKNNSIIRNLDKKGDLIDHLSFFPAPVIGVDEVGRGCLAGPVYAAAVVLKHERDNVLFQDSKRLSVKRREEISELIQKEHHYCFGFASVQEIDELNILQASLLAMKRAVLGLGLKQGHVLVDGNQLIPHLAGFEQTCIIQGDSRVKPIAAASILAKVERDQLMRGLGAEFPDYRFEEHKGYSTAIHKKIISEKGPTAHHRLTFAGVKEYVRGSSFEKRPMG